MADQASETKFMELYDEPEVSPESSLLTIDQVLEALENTVSTSASKFITVQFKQ